MKEKRMTIRITTQLDNQIKNIMKSGKYMNKSELLRDALWFGLNHINKQKEMKK